jgi:multicomponent Na+:H+ antiporter subunit G
MTLALEIISWVFLISGSFFAIVGGIGIVRMPEFYSRLHGGGVTDTLGAGLILVGLCFQISNGFILAKLLMILFFLMVSSPSSCHALARSALSQGVNPVLEINTYESNRDSNS